MSLDFGLDSVHVLITGASGGIGVHIVRTFIDLGARVTAQYNSKLDHLAEIKHPRFVAIQADVRDEASVGSLFAQAATNYPVEILVVNHGLSPQSNTPIADMGLDQWQNTLSINLTGSFLVAREYLRRLRTAQAAQSMDAANIIFVGSTAGKFGEALHGDYAASKSAIMYGLCNTLKNEIVAITSRGRVNCVNPGWTATPKKESVLTDAKFVDKILATVPLQKVAQPEDIARQIGILASPTISGHVSGMNVFVDGGMEGRMLFAPQQREQE